MLRFEARFGHLQNNEGVRQSPLATRVPLTDAFTPRVVSSAFSGFNTAVVLMTPSPPAAPTVVAPRVHAIVDGNLSGGLLDASRLAALAAALPERGPTPNEYRALNAIIKRRRKTGKQPAGGHPPHAPLPGAGPAPLAPLPGAGPPRADLEFPDGIPPNADIEDKDVKTYWEMLPKIEACATFCS